MKKRSIYIIIILISLVVFGCKYDFILEEEVPVTGDNISFATQVAPIFSNGNKCTECHKVGATNPDLTAANAYSQLMSKYVNTTTPASSKIYSVPGSAAHSWKGYTAAEAATVLKWIQEGAKNN
jgi:hypothetical protein